MEINFSIDYGLKSLCYLRTSLSVIKSYIESTKENLIYEDIKFDEYIRKEYDIILRMERLPLPKSLKRELRFLLNKQFSEIRRLWNSDLKIAINGMDFLAIRLWNLDGSINRKRVAKAVIEATDLQMNRCFILAFNYCLEKESVHYWDRMPINERIALPYFESPTNLGRNIFMDIYTWNKRHDQDVLAFAYNLSILEKDMKVKEIMQVAKRRRISPEVMRFIFTLLDENQKKHITLKNPAGVLRSLLTWPYHHQFTKLAIFLWNKINKKVFCRLIKNIVVELGRWPDMEHVQILKDFWEASPVAFKKYIENKPDYARLVLFFNSLGYVTWNEILSPI